MAITSVNPGPNGGTTQHVRPVRIDWAGGVVSFTFDDFPKSALSVGGALLTKHGSRGTYYVSLGKLGTEAPVGLLCEIDEVRAAHRDGHEVACHTWSHLNCKLASTEEILKDVDTNAEAFATALDGYAPINFAFPFGAISPNAKSVLAPRFSSCRGIQYGTNSGAVDLASLASTHVYARDFDAAALCALIDRNRELGGWLIFYTHDVTETPSLYGCTPAQLETLIAHAAAQSEILSVRDVMSRMSPGV
jgi:peptidoglycan/xylan/chitin deacetylase (PgdA/CDA1 family)